MGQALGCVENFRACVLQSKSCKRGPKLRCPSHYARHRVQPPEVCVLHPLLISAFGLVSKSIKSVRSSTKVPACLGYLRMEPRAPQVLELPCFLSRVLSSCYAGMTLAVTLGQWAGTLASRPGLQTKTTTVLTTQDPRHRSATPELCSRAVLLKLKCADKSPRNLVKLHVLHQVTPKSLHF